MILALDGGIGTCGYAAVRPRTGAIVEVGTVISKPAPGVDKHVDRMRRAARLGRTLFEIGIRHDVKLIAVETPSLGGPPKARLSMGIALYLFVGVVVGLAVSLNVDVVAVAPQEWQHAVAPLAVGESGKVDYELLFAELHDHVLGQCDTLSAIPYGQRNHALDASGVGLFAALVEHTQSMRVMEATR